MLLGGAGDVGFLHAALLLISTHPLPIPYTTLIHPSYFPYIQLSAADYQALCGRFHTVYLQGVPVLSERAHNEARRFITLVDELYNHQVLR